MLDSIRNLLSTGPKTAWVSSVIDPEFVISSEITPLKYEKKKEQSHNWELRLREPARDGNDIGHLNFRNEDGKIVSQIELLSGEQSTSMQLTPTEGEMEIVAVTTDGEVSDTSRVEFYEEVVAD